MTLIILFCYPCYRPKCRRFELVQQVHTGTHPFHCIWCGREHPDRSKQRDIAENKRGLRSTFLVASSSSPAIWKLPAAISESSERKKGDYFENLAKNIIKARRREEGARERVVLLQLMLTSNQGADETSRLSDDEIVAQSVFFLLVGYKNTSNTLAFISYFLAINPLLQDKLRSEIQEAKTSASATSVYDLAQSIDYLDSVINESVRLCPPIFQMNRSCQEDYDFNGVHIPAGMEVIIPTYAIHRDPDAWPNPEKFDPDRFRSDTDDCDRHSYQFLPFGAGPRNCIAMRFALMEIKIALVKVLSKYKFVQSPETQVPLALHTGVMLSPRNGVFLRVETA